MLLKVGNVDLTAYIQEDGFSVTRNDVDDSKTGRTLDGTMHRARIALKKKIEVNCRPLTQTEAQTVLTAILPEWVSVTYIDPQAGTRSNIQMYSNNVPAVAARYDKDTGLVLWKGIKFPLVER